MKLLKEKTVIITGATRGIGKGILDLFIQHEANVIFTYRNSHDQALSIEKEYLSKGFKIKGYQSDASDLESVKKLMDDIKRDYNTIDILVNNAGVTRDGLLMRMSDSDFSEVMNINMNSVFNMTKSIIPIMLKQRNGSIINMSSVVGVKGNAGQANYSASKAAINGFTKSVALELGSRNIRCNAIDPVFI